MMRTDIDNGTAGEAASELELMRSRWRAVRDNRLALKTELLASGLEKSMVRKHHEYRKLQKEQNRLSVRMKHIEKRLNKKRANSAKKQIDT